MNYGLAYGMEAYGLSQRAEIEVDEAKEILEAYFAGFPRIRAFMDNVVKEARNQGYTTTLLGRRRLLPELSSDNFRVRDMGKRMAQNAPVQGSAADIFKVAMVNLHRALEEQGLRSRMILTVHDELVLEVPHQEHERVAAPGARGHGVGLPAQRAAEGRHRLGRHLGGRQGLSSRTGAELPAPWDLLLWSGPPATGTLPASGEPRGAEPHGGCELRRRTRCGAAALAAAALAGAVVAIGAAGTPVPAAPSIVVSLTFDDGLASQYAAAGQLASRGMAGTFYVNSAFLGGNGDMSRGQVQSLAAAGHEIGGHTAHHTDVTTLTAATGPPEVCGDRNTLLGLGVGPVASFAYPFGHVNPAAEQLVRSCGYGNGRWAGYLGTAGVERIPPGDPYALRTVDFAGATTTPATLLQYITNARTRGGGWLIFTFHAICDNQCAGPANSFGTAAFTTFLDGLVTQRANGVVVQTVGDVMAGVPAAGPAATGPAATGPAATGPAATGPGPAAPGPGPARRRRARPGPPATGAAAGSAAPAGRGLLDGDVRRRRARLRGGPAPMATPRASSAHARRPALASSTSNPHRRGPATGWPTRSAPCTASVTPGPTSAAPTCPSPSWPPGSGSRRCRRRRPAPATGCSRAGAAALARGDAPVLGDVSAVDLNGSVLDSVATPTGLGYWLVAADGGIFAFGDAAFLGSLGDVPLNAPVRALVPTASDRGYWMIATDGGVFAFGDAGYVGSVPAILAPGQALNQAISGMVRYGGGYLVVAEDGGIFSFSDLPFLGSLGDAPPDRPVVAVAAAS